MDEIKDTGTTVVSTEPTAEVQPTAAGAPPAAEPTAPAEAAAAEVKPAEEAKPAPAEPASEKNAGEKPAEESVPDVGALTRRLAQAELRAAAAAAGVPAAKLPYVAKLCDLAPLCEKGADMGELAAAQVARVLQDLPELGATAAVGSLGDHKRMSALSEESRIAAEFAQQL